MLQSSAHWLPLDMPKYRAHALIKYLVKNVDACTLNGKLALSSVLSLAAVENYTIYNLCTLTLFRQGVS